MSRAQGQSSLTRQGTTSSSSSTSNLKLQPRSVSAGSDYKKPIPSPQANSSQGAPPPYSQSFNAGASSAAARRAPPPPPPLKTKPTLNAPQIKYVVALYDFTAQVIEILSSYEYHC
jgi:amphiphysin